MNKNNILKIIAVVLIGALMIMTVLGCAKIEIDLDEYKLVFYDDFDGTDLDSEKWEKCPEEQRQDYKGWWRDDCIAVSDGSLVVTARLKDGEMQSGAIQSKGHFENKFGYYEVKFKVDDADGLWYAFWLTCDGVRSVGDEGRDGTEIDVFEVVPAIRHLETNFHWDGYGIDHKSGGKYSRIGKSFFDEWHIAKFLWTEDSYTVEIDGKTTFHTSGEKSAKYGSICQVPTYIRFSSEFGSWGGQVDEDMQPAKMLIDYVKVYQK